VLTQTDAEAIAKKLRCTYEEKAHRCAEVFEAGRLIARFGIRRASKGKSHSHIPRELHITQSQCWDLRRCPLSREDYLNLLREKHLL
jgi:nicotinic acid phosphoribosyltransferase